MDLKELRRHIERQPFTPLFATLSGAHLYGFESPDSDVDLRGAFVLPLEKIIGLQTGAETVTTTYFENANAENQASRGGAHPNETESTSGDRGPGLSPGAPLEMDLVCHDILKYCKLLHKGSGEILEQLYSPLVVWPSPELEELRELFKTNIGRGFFYHYRGFLGNQLRFLDKPDATVKDALYAYRVALTGIHLLTSGQPMAHLPTLLEDYPQDGLEELLQQKRTQNEKTVLDAELKKFHQTRLVDLDLQLQQAFKDSPLPEGNRGLEQLNQFVIRVRLGGR